MIYRRILLSSLIHNIMSFVLPIRWRHCTATAAATATPATTATVSHPRMQNKAAKERRVTAARPRH